MEKQAASKVCCVTGGSGYLGSWLVKKLLEKGYTVHATLRNLDDKSKVGFLESLPGADTNLVLFQAYIYNPHEFKHAIQGCEFVFHVATPKQTADTQSSQKIIEGAISGVRSIAESCLQSPAVKRLIYTASVLGASPLTKDGFNVEFSVKESSWTHVDASFASTHGLQHMRTYTVSKTLAEKEALRYNGEANANGGKLQVVSLACGLIGGETLLSHAPSSVAAMFSQLTGNLSTFMGLEYLEKLLGSIPMVHIDDVCEAHVFCMEKPSMAGRFICAAANPTIAQIAAHFRENYPQHQIPQHYRLMGEEKEGIAWDKSKLVKMGFVYKYDMENILNDSVKCGRRLGAVVSIDQ
ncbi:anthocyanidin reductase ((2S)-flavan-3-ol-forming)-like isoform X1 [Hibiscus syriacus]|uniref:anthocyanidin reductase ((2S)-flavan-3-ol-forming)-like isoform X1 n=1 Tax=Hibiscus syriacus TaxID=106335 RepID=UPI0019216987|nr:anthocyanidin reductase ((2S)-flavan-3-ol-forming)-like isoform X1 [Hibiscus syriacus]